MRRTIISYIRRFKCQDCGSEITAPKLSKTGNGHIKTMYCPICKEQKDFIQIGIDKARM